MFVECVHIAAHLSVILMMAERILQLTSIEKFNLAQIEALVVFD